jgi:hypothetical protein
MHQCRHCFTRVLQYVLAVGNYLNSESNARGGAYGYRLDTLKKLSTVKGTDSKTTLLDFVARAAFEEAKVRGLARLPQDLAPVSVAKPESLDAVRNPAWYGRKEGRCD